MATAKQLENIIKRKTLKVAKCQKEIKAETSAIAKLKGELVIAKKKEAEVKAKAKTKAKPKAKAKAKPKK
jgi:hypothetical protein